MLDGKVKEASEEYMKTSEAVAAEANASSDPTLANAASTELQDTAMRAEPAATTEPATTAAPSDQIAPPAQTMASDAANPVAQTSWDTSVNTSLDSSATADGWVEVPRDPAETDVGLQATASAADTGMKNNPTAAKAPKQSTAQAPVAKERNGDGFEQVAHHQRQPSVRGRGRGRGDGFRGRARGDTRGRGRGRSRGRGAPGAQ